MKTSKTRIFNDSKETKKTKIRYFGPRLKAFRVLQNITVDTILTGEEKLNKEKLNSYEKAKYLPSEDCIYNHLAEKLNVPENYWNEYFLLNKLLGIRSFSLRNSTVLPEISMSFPEKHKKISQKIGIEIINKYKLEIENFVELSQILHSKIFNEGIIYSPGSISGIEQVRVMLNLGLSPIYSVTQMLEELGIFVINCELPNNLTSIAIELSLLNPLSYIGKLYIICANNDIKALDKRRALLESFASILHTKYKLNLSKDAFENSALEILLPKQALKKILIIKRNNLSVDEITNIANSYGLTAEDVVKQIWKSGLFINNLARKENRDNLLNGFDPEKYKSIYPEEYKSIEKLANKAFTLNILTEEMYNYYIKKEEA